jgi:predicted GIY-YIG superfamily endonuclease
MKKECVVYIIRSKDRRRAYVGLTVAPVVRLMAHHSAGTNPVRELLSVSHSVDISRPMSPERAARLEIILIERMAKAGVKMANRAAGGALGGNEHVVTKDLAIQRALRYPNVSKFSIGAPATYRMAKQNGWLDEIAQKLKARNAEARARYWERVNQPDPPVVRPRMPRRRIGVELKDWRRPIVRELNPDRRWLRKVKLKPAQ